MAECIVCKKKAKTKGGGCGQPTRYPRGWELQRHTNVGEGDAEEYLDAARTCPKCTKLPEDVILVARIGAQVEDQLEEVKGTLAVLADDRTRLRRLKAARKRASARAVKATAIRQMRAKKLHVPPGMRKKKK